VTPLDVPTSAGISTDADRTRPAISLAILRLLRWSDHLFLGLAGGLSAIYLVAISLGVFYRYVLELPLAWTEELAEYLFVWSAFLAAAVSVGRSDQFHVPLLIDSLRPKARRVLRVAIDLLELAFSIVMIRFGFEMANRMMIARSPVLPIPQGVAYLVIPIAGLYMAVHLTCRLVIPGVRSSAQW
jgi:TRAP-type transport system small permease protein